DGRTHLLLDAESVIEEAPRRPRPGPPARAAGSRAKASDDERTHLLLDAADLKDEAEPAAAGRAAAPPRAPGRLLAAGGVLDDVMYERWLAALALLALACGVLPTPLDAWEGGNSVSHGASLLLFVALGAYGLAWLGRSGLERGGEPGLVTRRAQAAFTQLRRDLGELRHSPAYLRLQLTGQVIALAGLVGLTAASSISLLRALFGSYDAPSVFRLVCGLLALIGAGLIFLGERAAPAAAPSPDDFAESTTAARHLPPIVDLNERLPASFIGGYTTFHKVLVVMSQWRGDAGPDRTSCQAALQRHLQRHLAGSRVERAAGTGPWRAGRAQLLVDGMIAIEVRCGFGSNDAEQALGLMRQQVQARGARPTILCVFDAPRAALFESPATASLIELHEAAPLLTARMPARI
ncbi:MAG TPA: hypothetical protein VNN80_34015, partial [Polyangiaceae bacterium]|nr:hypothetical protein [Polyangiaceae bacterium]